MNKNRIKFALTCEELLSLATYIAVTKQFRLEDQSEHNTDRWPGIESTALMLLSGRARSGLLLYKPRDLSADDTMLHIMTQLKSARSNIDHNKIEYVSLENRQLKQLTEYIAATRFFRREVISGYTKLYVRRGFSDGVKKRADYWNELSINIEKLYFTKFRPLQFKRRVIDNAV